MLRSELHHDHKLAALAAGRSVTASIGGMRKAVGDITFSGQPVADETVTINGVAFTAKASGATGNQFNIGGDLTTTIDNLATVLNASVVAAVTQATYSNVGGTKLHVVFDEYGNEGNDFTLATNIANATASDETLTEGMSADLFELTAETHALVTTAGSTVTEFDLPLGEEGQEIALYLATKGAGSNAQVNGVFVGGTKLTFDTAAKWAKLKFLGSQWVPIVNTGTIS